MRNRWAVINPCVVVMWLLAACGQPEPRAPKPDDDASPIVAALRAGKFDDALRASTDVLARDPGNAQASAVRAIARYQRAAAELVTELGAVIDRGESLKALDHERGRAAWRTFLEELEIVDRDLATVAADPNFALELCIACWEHDWNRNGRIDDGDRKLFELEFDGKGGELAAGDPRRRPTYRFDRGDALWARAMIAFQRAGTELVLSYRWSELDKLFAGDEPRITIKLVDPGRVKHARELVLAGLGFADQTREAYLAETDDDREWVPNPRQHSYAMPLAVDAELYTTWAAVIGDVRRMLASKDNDGASQEGIAMREVATMIMGPAAAHELPNAFVDLGRMLREPSDITIDFHDELPHPQKYERLLRGLLGHGYAKTMRASPLVARLRHMKEQVERGQDTAGRKLRYLLWLN
jgi:hypothetical protein